jgi:hypothetical protein
METWKEIEGFEKYMVSDHGNIMSLNYNKTGLRRLLKGSHQLNGYCRVDLRNEDKKRHSLLVHRVVAQAFIQNPEGKPEVNHKDGIKTNNSVDNLEFVTAKENQQHSCRAGLHKRRFNEFQVRRMRLLKEVDPAISYAKLGRLFDAPGTVIRHIILRKTWQHV